MVEMKNFVIWIQAASLFMQKQIIFTKILQKMLKHDLTLQTLKQTDHYLKEKKKINQTIERETRRTNCEILIGLRAETYSYFKKIIMKIKNKKPQKSVS